MARTTVIVLEDDLDGGTATEQLTFSIDGVEYEIDLNDANAQKLRSLLDPYMAAGRRKGGRLRRQAPGATRHAPKQLQEIRDWARSNGHAVADRGRIPQSVLNSYAEANA
jgi:hypothetical protein